MRRFLSSAIVIVVAVAALVAVPTPAHAGEYFNKDKTRDVRLEPTGDKAAVYVFRPATMGAAIKTWSFYDEELIGVSKARAYSAVLVPAGRRIFWSKAENTSALEVDVKAGETYYFKQAIKMGFNKARVKLEAIDATEAEKYFKKCGYVEPTAEGRERAGEIIANRYERAQNKVQEQAEGKSRSKKDKKKGKKGG